MQNIGFALNQGIAVRGAFGSEMPSAPYALIGRPERAGDRSVFGRLSRITGIPQMRSRKFPTCERVGAWMASRWPRMR